jgi:hypothetical protein
LGVFYGATTSDPDLQSRGIVFRLTPNKKRTSWAFANLWYFGNNAKNGDIPNGGLVFDESGALYGTTQINYTPANCGVAFMMAPGKRSDIWPARPLHAFQGGSDGCQPMAGLTEYNSYWLVGTTSRGGATNACGGCGTVFAVAKCTRKPSGAQPWNCGPQYYTAAEGAAVTSLSSPRSPP